MAGRIAGDHDAKRRAILATAARYFAEDGYDRASMSQLARACDVSKSLIYHYFASKEALLFAILEAHLDRLRAEVEALPDRETPEDTLRALIALILHAYRGADAEHRLQIEAMRQLPPERQRALADVQKRIVARVAAQVAALAPDLPRPRLHAATMSLFGMLNWFFLWHRPEGELTREDYARIAGDILLGGLRAVSAEASR